MGTLVLAGGLGAAVVGPPFVTPGTPGHPIVVPGKGESVVEGHAVFAILESAHAATIENETYMAAVAVLVREVECSTIRSRFPGVLWFNDQYLVDPRDNTVGSCGSKRHPCTGAVLAYDPARELDSINVSGTPNLSAAMTYVRSFLIDPDPNGHSWIIDEFVNPVVTPPAYVWASAILGRGTTTPRVQTGNGTVDGFYDNASRDLDPYFSPATVPDNEMDCAPFEDYSCTDPVSLARHCQPPGYPNEGGGSPSFSDAVSCPAAAGEPGFSCSNLLYNALVLIDLKNLNTTPVGVKDHSIGSADLANDVSGCTNSVAEWPCPSGAGQGNSHRYGTPAHETQDVRPNHGGSGDCDGDALADDACHATFLVNVLYGFVQRSKMPAARVFAVCGGGNGLSCQARGAVE